MKKLSLISPYISLLLIILVLSGSFGFTLIHHSCFHCGTNETYATFTGEEMERSCHCHHAEDQYQHQPGMAQVSCDGCCNSSEGDLAHRCRAHEYTITDDCCSHDAERVVTDELLRADSQTKIVPYFLAATVVAVMMDAPETNIRYFSGNLPSQHRRDLTTLFCQIQS